MQRIFGSKDLQKNSGNAVIALGNFDGLHRAHVELLELCKTTARDLNCKSAVLTFNPHPVEILSPKQRPKLLQMIDQKLDMMDFLGIDQCIIEPFTHDFAHMNPKTFFCDYLAKQLNSKAVMTGYDFTFGLHREGNVQTLNELGKQTGIKVLTLDAKFIGDTLISSTNIRNLLLSGDLAGANNLLGRPYSIRGRVIKGRGIGGTLNAHTANLETQNEIVPEDGIYISKTKIIGGKEYESITSVGFNPTFGDGIHKIETHFIDVNVDVLGDNLEIYFMKKMRNQVQFDSPDILKERIKKDIDEAREFHSTNRSEK